VRTLACAQRRECPHTPASRWRVAGAMTAALAVVSPKLRSITRWGCWVHGWQGTGHMGHGRHEHGSPQGGGSSTEGQRKPALVTAVPRWHPTPQPHHRPAWPIQGGPCTAWCRGRGATGGHPAPEPPLWHAPNARRCCEGMPAHNRTAPLSPPTHLRCAAGPGTKSAPPPARHLPLPVHPQEPVTVPGQGHHVAPAQVGGRGHLGQV
jgi:hypothetical protein